MDNSIYKQKGYRNRDDYLDSLAMEYNVPKMVVYSAAELLGPSEDFDGLITTLEEATWIGLR